MHLHLNGGGQSVSFVCGESNISVCVCVCVVMYVVSGMNFTTIKHGSDDIAASFSHLLVLRRTRKYQIYSEELRRTSRWVFLLGTKNKSCDFAETFWFPNINSPHAKLLIVNFVAETESQINWLISFKWCVATYRLIMVKMMIFPSLNKNEYILELSKNNTRTHLHNYNMCDDLCRFTNKKNTYRRLARDATSCWVVKYICLDYGDRI